MIDCKKFHSLVLVSVKVSVENVCWMDKGIYIYIYRLTDKNTLLAMEGHLGKEETGKYNADNQAAITQGKTAAASPKEHDQVYAERRVLRLIRI